MKWFLVFTFVFAFSPQTFGKTSADYEKEMEILKTEVEKLKEGIEKQKGLVKELEFYCTDPSHSCAQALADERAILKDLEKKLEDKNEALAQAETGRAESFKQESANESARKKAKKQKKLLMLSAAVSAGMGGYLLVKHCKPSAVPPNKMGCIMGPLALAQALVSYKSAKDMGKVEDQFAALAPGETPFGENSNNGGSGGNGGPNEEGGEDDPPILCGEESLLCDANGNPKNITVPCPGDPSKDCILTKDGTRITAPGGLDMEIASLASTVPTGPEVDRAMTRALNKQRALIEQAKEIDPSYQTLSPGSFMAGGTGSSGGGGNDMSSGGATSLAGGMEEELEEEEPETTGDTGTGAVSSFAGGTVGSGGGGYGEGFSPMSAEEDPDGEVDRFLRKLGLKKKKKSNPATAGAKKTVPFGTEKIGAASRSLFRVIQNSYQRFRNRGEFIEDKRPQR